jgi:hypothetical protein
MKSITQCSLRALLGVLALSSPIGAFAAGGGGCPNIKAIGNFKPSGLVGASFSSAGDTSTYFFDSVVDRSPITDGVPGLISYCVYPSQPPANPDSADANAVGANADPFDVNFGSAQGFFSFTRGGGNPSNIPLDGTTNIQIGTAKWCKPDPITSACTVFPPTAQDIVLHINDAAECDLLYGGDPGTCFVLPNGEEPPPRGGCPGSTVACKSVIIDEAITSLPLTVPVKTKLHLHYTYLINNTTGEDMQFYIPGSKTKDINAGGGKDYFGCEQQPYQLGEPGALGSYPNDQFTGLKLDFKAGSGVCDQSRFFLTNAGANNPYVLAPGGSIAFTVEMVTRTNKGGKLEYTSCGSHLLNSGFTVKWFAPSDYPLLHSFSTNITPLFVNVVGCPQ